MSTVARTADGRARTLPATRVTLPDVLGRGVLASEYTFGAGTHEVRIDARRLVPGDYVARVVAGAGSSSVRFTIAR